MQIGVYYHGVEEFLASNEYISICRDLADVVFNDRGLCRQPNLHMISLASEKSRVIKVMGARPKIVHVQGRNKLAKKGREFS